MSDEYWERFGSIDGVEWSDVDGAVQVGTKPTGVLILKIDGELFECWYDSPDNRWAPPHKIRDENVVSSLGDIDLSEFNTN